MMTLREIAQITGYSRSTVSAALRNRADIPEATRIKIQEAAQQAGYVKDPRLNELMNHLRHAKGRRASVRLGVVVPNLNPKQWKSRPWYEKLRDGLSEGADELGYMLEYIPLSKITASA